VIPCPETKNYLICRDWVDYKTGQRLIDWPTANRYKAGILYSYKSSYSPDTDVFAFFEALPKMSVRD
jgi:hypothetical protein